ncbi:MAG: ABC transporter permease [Thiohalocapsa sp.]
MSGLDSVLIAFGALRTNKLRSALTILGIIVGVAAVVCMVAIGAGARARITDNIQTLGANLLYVIPGAARSGGVRLASANNGLSEDDAEAIQREVPGVQLVTPLVARGAQAIAGNRNWAVSVVGNNGDYLLARDWPLLAGRAFRDDEVDSGAKVAILGKLVAEKLFESGDPIGATLRIRNVPLTVIGVLQGKGETAGGHSQDNVVLVPLLTARSRLLAGEAHQGNRFALDFILVKARNAAALPALSRQVTALLRQRHRLREGNPDDFRVQDPAELLTAQEGSVRAFGILLAAIASVSLVVGGISVMNIMLVAVAERTREVGLRMAVGARRRDIRTQFLIEALALAGVGGVLGFLAGAAAAAAVANYAGWPVLISPFAAILAIATAGGVGLGFGLYPAYRASRLDPMQALRFE